MRILLNFQNKIIHVGSGRVTSIEENRTPKSVEEIGW